jgi:hypothetical protein
MLDGKRDSSFSLLRPHDPGMREDFLNSHPAKDVNPGYIFILRLQIGFGWASI